MVSSVQFVHDRAFILSTGDEIMTGQLQDSNARWLSAALIDEGILVAEHGAVGDVEKDLCDAILRAAAKAPLVIMSGGLGPTDGDLTREAICRAADDQLVLDPKLRSELAAMLARRGRELTPRQERQAFRPSRATAIPNAFGTAPGVHARIQTQAPWGLTDVFCLPGPPGELRPMFAAAVRPLLRPPQDRVVLTRLLHVVGMPEAECVQKLGELTKRDRVPLVGITASGGILTLRIRYEAREPNSPQGRAAAAARVDAVESEIRDRLGDHVMFTGAAGAIGGMDHLARQVIEMLRSGSAGPRTLAVVESCTGGMLGEMLTSISGSSSVFVGGFITYANALKERVGVLPETLACFGAVSAQTAREMALAGLGRSGADCCLAITGIAGPDGGSDAKPVGTVHIGLAWGSSLRGADIGSVPEVHSRHFLFTGDRADVRCRACVTALAMLRFLVLRGEASTPKLLWEV
jgi:nicotinamide-nucleotide amidase